MKWSKIGRSVSPEGTTVIYCAEGHSALVIESRKRHIQHANGSGTWDYTSYFVVLDGQVQKEKRTLKEAKEFAESMVRK